LNVSERMPLEELLAVQGQAVDVLVDPLRRAAVERALHVVALEREHLADALDERVGARADALARAFAGGWKVGHARCDWSLNQSL
jgi:hypothetical protein